MKNKRFRIPIIGLICCMLLGTIAFAVNGRKITATYGGITIYLNGQKPVSYTHLDVYKRQVLAAGHYI